MTNAQGRARKRMPLFIACSLTITGLLLACGAQTVGALDLPDNRLKAKFVDQKELDAHGSPIRLAREDWQGAKTLVASDPGWAKWLASEKLVLDGWMTSSQDRAEWLAGWYHDFVDTGSGMPLRWTAAIPATLASPQATQSKTDGAWIAIFRDNNIQKTLAAARFYRLTGDAHYAEWAARQLDFYAANYSNWPVQRRQGYSQMMGQALDEATVSMNLLDAARLLGTYADGRRQRTWKNDLFGPIYANLEKSYWGKNNISVWLRSAMASIGIYVGDGTLVNRALADDTGLLQLLESCVTNDFIWFEGSLAYNDYVVAAIIPLLQQSSLTTGYSPQLQRIALIAGDMMLAPLYLRFDDGYTPTPSDSIGRRKAPNLGLLESARRVMPTRIGTYQAASRYSWERLLDPIASDPPAPPLPATSSVSLEASRMAFIRSGSWQVFFHYGQLTANHAQAEALTYELVYDSTPISVDPGTVTYGSYLHQQYFTQPAANNVPMANDLGQEGWSAGRLISFQPGRARVVAEQGQYRNDVGATRDLRIEKNSFVDELTVIPDSKPPGSTVGSVVNFNCQPDLSDFQTAIPTAKELPAMNGFQFWTSVRKIVANNSLAIDMGCAGKKFRVRWTVPGDFYVLTGNVPDSAQGKLRTGFYLKVPASAGQIKTSITPL